MGPFSQSQWPSWGYSNASDQFSNYSQFSDYSAGVLADSLEAYQAQHNRLVQHQQMSRSTESKPRLSKEEVEVLESEFQRNHKPSSSTKKALAESMRVDNARINNWFQNRRAREKKEKNIREYEAKQHLEKEQGEPGQGPQSAMNRQRDFSTCSAPFPQLSASSMQQSEASRSPSDPSVPDERSDAGQSSDSDSTSPLPVPLHLALDNNESHILDQADEDDKSIALSDRIDDYLAMQEQPFLSTNINAASQFFAGFAAIESPENLKYENDVEVDLSAGSSPLADDYGITSPDAADLGSRRNRRPAPLLIGGVGRSHSYSSRPNQTTGMRRISSSASSGRVTKSVAPQSPFFDRSAVSLLQQRFPSPRAAGPRASAAPPTPDTPVTLQPQEPSSVPGLYTLHGKLTSPDMFISDPTLRTPPTTPGFSDGLFNFGSGFGMAISEEPLITPDMSNLHTGIDMVGNATNFARFLSNNTQCSPTQPMAPMYQTQLSQSYLGFAGSDGNSDISWSDLSPSASTSLQPRQRFMSLNNLPS
ncbi:hypothetical protein E4U09_007412 [Claviceps aff. purpurea]|uniref:Homeobox domain-containing protein n=1 Tax=Claviceps aff. purpurea TaxID=1967640 RepID=A0A9P7U3L0_9HYPO|nr:hypothetical protein E4U09_007412 [Claviceps aff. purpurea]